MTRDELINLLKENLKPDTQMDFLISDKFEDGTGILAFLDIRDICMNADVDDPNNKNRGGIVFKIEKDLSI